MDLRINTTRYCTVAILSLFLSCPVLGCFSPPKRIALGTWHYRLLVQGSAIGTATMSSEETKDAYISTVEMEAVAGTVKNTTSQVVTETKDFKPVKIEIRKKNIFNNTTQEFSTIAECKGQKIVVTMDTSKATITPDKPFIFDGMFFMSELVKTQFKTGTRITANLYDPTIELEELIPVSMEVMGKESVEVNNKSVTCIRLSETIGTIKNIDIFVDEAGVLQKATLYMLNNKIELIVQ